MCLEVLCDGKVVSPIIYLLYSMVQMCTIQLFGLLALSSVNSTEVVLLDATVGVVYGNYSI